MILVHQRYYAKRGFRDKVVQTRLQASQRLQDLGVPTGTVWVPVSGRAGLEGTGLPDVIWECSYPTLEEREAIRERQESDPQFHAIRVSQRPQIERWVREHYERVDPSDPAR